MNELNTVYVIVATIIGTVVLYHFFLMLIRMRQAEKREADIVENYLEQERKRCKSSPYYFFTNYWQVNGKPATTAMTERDFNSRFFMLMEAGQWYKSLTEQVEANQTITLK